MSPSSSRDRETMVITDVATFAGSFARDVDCGLRDTPKHIPCIYFYDYKGSLLFEKICRLPEYYLTCAETEILKIYSGEIVSCLPPDSVLVELGSGSSIKTRLIIEEMLHRQDKLIYSPIDVSRQMLQESSDSLLGRYENLEIVSVAAEYEEGLRRLDMFGGQVKLILWLGSSIGNFEQAEAVRFLESMIDASSSDDFFLIGFDLEKDRAVLEKAYNDSQDITAEFNLNLLARINRELGGEFDLDTFRHRAVYNEEKSRIEMYVISAREQEVYIADLNRSYQFDRDEWVHTENSHKYSPKVIERITDRVGLHVIDQWFDSNNYFNLTLLKSGKR